MLEDTLVGFGLNAWTVSPIKGLVAHPKFYRFDNGVINALTRRLAEPPDPIVRGVLVELFMIREARRRLDDAQTDARLHY